MLKKVLKEVTRIEQWQQEIYTALHNIDATWVTTGIFDVARIPNLDASKITSGRFPLARLPTSATANRFLVVRTANADPLYDALVASDIPSLDASKITSGRFSLSRLPDGTSGNVLVGQGTGVDMAWKDISGITGTITDSQHGIRGSGLHADSHARLHALDSASDHSGTITDAQHGSRGSGLHADSHALDHRGRQLLQADVIANRPAAGTVGRIFYATDQGIFYYDNGTAWVEFLRAETVSRLAYLAERAHSSLTGIGPDDHHPRAHDHSNALDGSPIAVAGVPDLPASKITSGRFTLSRMPDGSSGYFLKGQGAGVDPTYALLTSEDIPSLDISKITTGLQRGSGTTDINGDATITFPAAFNSTPLIFLQGRDAGARGIVLDVVSKSTTQFVVKARKVTGITSGTSGSHTHTFTPSGSISSVSAGTPSGSISSVSDHTHSNPNTSTTGAHTHSNPNTSGPSAVTGIPVFSDIGTCPSGHSNCTVTSRQINMPTETHYHQQGATGSAGDHYHTIGATGAAGGHSHTFTGSALPTHNHEFTGTQGDTDSSGDHSHTVDAPNLSVDFDWLAIEP
jgi:hypothetical protein